MAGHESEPAKPTELSREDWGQECRISGLRRMLSRAWLSPPLGCHSCRSSVFPPLFLAARSPLWPHALCVIWLKEASWGGHRRLRTIWQSLSLPPASAPGRTVSWESGSTERWGLQSALNQMPWNGFIRLLPSIGWKGLESSHQSACRWPYVGENDALFLPRFNSWKQRKTITIKQ